MSAENCGRVYGITECAELSALSCLATIKSRGTNPMDDEATDVAVLGNLLIPDIVVPLMYDHCLH